jgi:hypothetical protein
MRPVPQRENAEDLQTRSRRRTKFFDLVAQEGGFIFEKKVFYRAKISLFITHF